MMAMSLNNKGNLNVLIFIVVALFLATWAWQLISAVMGHFSTMPQSGQATMFNNAAFGFILTGLVALVGVVLFVIALGLLARFLLGRGNQLSRATQKPIAKVIGRGPAKTIYGNTKGRGF